MVHSMTAFARVEKAGAQGTLSWELRSVNSRYLEPHLRLPESFRDLEGAVREALRQGISRLWAGEDAKKILDDIAKEWDAITQKVGVDKQKAVYNAWAAKGGAYPK